MGDVKACKVGHMKNLNYIVIILLAVLLGAVFYVWNAPSSGQKTFAFVVQTKVADQAQTNRMHLVIDGKQASLESFMLAQGVGKAVPTQKILANLKNVTTCSFITRECEQSSFKAKPQGDRQLIHEFSYEVIDDKASVAGIPCKKLRYQMDIDIDHTVLRQSQNVEVDACFADLGSELLVAFPQLSVGSGFHQIEGVAAEPFKEFLALIKGLTPLDMNVSGKSGIISAMAAELDAPPAALESTLKLLTDKKVSPSIGQFKTPEGFKISKNQKNKAAKTR